MRTSPHPPCLVRPWSVALLLAGLALPAPSGAGGLFGLTMASPLRAARSALGRASPGAATPAILALPELGSASDITRERAERILQAAGYYHPRILSFHRKAGASSRFDAALMALEWGETYERPKRRVTLGPQMKAATYRVYRWLRAAVRDNRATPTVSKDATRELYAQALRAAAPRLTRVPAARRSALLQSLMKVESTRVHWDDFVPTISHAGAVGFGQLLPVTAASLGDAGINPFDPRGNVTAIATYLNQLIGQGGSLREGLAMYNGGMNPPASSYAYADRILRGARKVA